MTRVFIDIKSPVKLTFSRFILWLSNRIFPNGKKIKFQSIKTQLRNIQDNLISNYSIKKYRKHNWKVG